MSEQIKHGERETEEEVDQEHLDTRPQDEIDDDKVKIPKQDYAKIKKSLKQANQEAKQFREQLQRYKELGVDPDELEELLELREKLASGDNDVPKDDNRVDRKELDKQRKSLEQKYKAQLDELQREKADMQKRLETTLIESAAREAIIAEKGVPDLLLDRVVKAAKLVQNDRGGYNVLIVDENGEPEFNDRGEYMTIQDHVKQLKQHEVFGRAFDVAVKQGAGIQSQQGNRKPSHTVTKSQLRKDKKARNKFIAENGVDAYNALPE